MANRVSLSACVICKNQVERIGLTLDSLGWCADVVVVDSGSTDGTVEFCRGHALAKAGKLRVIHQDWLGYNGQRRFAVGQCRNDWVLMLDADEECSEELRGEIEELEEGVVGGVAMLEMPRRNYVARRHVRCWGPDWQSRLVHRERVEWGAASLPEERRAKAGFGMGRMRGALLHNRLTPYTPADFCDGRRMQEYGMALAATMAARGKRAGFMNLVFRPWMTFLKYYVLRGGFLQGRFGLVICYKTTIGVMLKYSLLYGEELKERRG